MAELVDGAFGVTYGLIASMVLLSFAVTPAAASAGSQARRRNAKWQLFRTLAMAGGMAAAAASGDDRPDRPRRRPARDQRDGEHS